MGHDDKEIRRNGSGYFDPTAYEAMKHIQEEKEHFDKLLHTIFAVCDLAGFRLEERVVLRDLKTGKVYR